MADNLNGTPVFRCQLILAKFPSFRNEVINDFSVIKSVAYMCQNMNYEAKIKIKLAYEASGWSKTTEF